MGNSDDFLDKLRAERDKFRDMAEEMAKSDDFDSEDSTFKDAESRAKKLDVQIQRLGEITQQRTAADAFDAQMSKAAKLADQKRRDTEQVQSRGTWGSRFVQSEIFTEYRGRGQSHRYEIEVDDLQTRALPTGISDLIDAGLTFGKTSVSVQPPATPTPLLDAVSTVNVSFNAIEYVAWQVVSGGADIVPEKGVKPPIEYGPTVESDTLDMIAVYTQLTRQLLEDAPAVRSLIDTDLRRQILIKEEAEAAAAIEAADLPTATGDSLLAAIRVAIGNVQAAGYNPNAVLLNPADYADLDLDVMDVTVNGPTIGQRFWGLTPIPSAAQTLGRAVVADFKTAVNHFVRSQVSLYITDSHDKTFLSNVYTLLAERRSKTAVVRPDAASVATAGSGS